LTHLLARERFVALRFEFRIASYRYEPIRHVILFEQRSQYPRAEKTILKSRQMDTYLASSPGPLTTSTPQKMTTPPEPEPPLLLTRDTIEW
jgi:hypothetical protein